jgi:hypothetical protein
MDINFLLILFLASLSEIGIIDIAVRGLSAGVFVRSFEW